MRKYVLLHGGMRKKRSLFFFAMNAICDVSAYLLWWHVYNKISIVLRMRYVVQVRACYGGMRKKRSLLCRICGT